MSMAGSRQNVDPVHNYYNDDIFCNQPNNLTVTGLKTYRLDNHTRNNVWQVKRPAMSRLGQVTAIIKCPSGLQLIDSAMCHEKFAGFSHNW